MKNLFRKKKEGQPLITKKSEKDKEIDKKVVESVDKVLKEYKRVFERLAEYDRT